MNTTSNAAEFKALPTDWRQDASEVGSLSSCTVTEVDDERYQEKTESIYIEAITGTYMQSGSDSANSAYNLADRDGTHELDQQLPLISREGLRKAHSHYQFSR